MDTPLAEKDRLAPERVSSDTLERGDIVMTDKSAFVFKARDERRVDAASPISPGTAVIDARCHRVYPTAA
jgi:hypothetical protein